MPGWYEKVKGQLDSKQLQAVAVIQEQHGRRTRLLNQWKQMKIHLLFDPLNRLDVQAVPITLLVDQHGVIRYRNPKDQDLAAFLNDNYESPKNQSENVPPGSQWQDGDKLAMLGKHDQAIQWYSDHLKSNDARLHFRLGVAYRMRYDASNSVSSIGDFVKAIDHWQQALALHPNQYIWRRRIQQYGPVLDKPYPFYDWVETARQEIADRGEEPVTLAIEPAGAELVGPRFREKATSPTTNPDPKGEISRDQQASFLVNTTVVPSTDKRQNAVRVHIEVEPNSGFGWNNEAGPTVLWIDAPAKGKSSQQKFALGTGAKAATSFDRRKAEFEIRGAGTTTVTGYLLAHICEKATGVCSYVRTDIRFAVK